MAFCTRCLSSPGSRRSAVRSSLLQTVSVRCIDADFQAAVAQGPAGPRAVTAAHARPGHRSPACTRRGTASSPHREWCRRGSSRPAPARAARPGSRSSWSATRAATPGRSADREPRYDVEHAGPGRDNRTRCRLGDDQRPPVGSQSIAMADMSQMSRSAPAKESATGQSVSTRCPARRIRRRGLGHHTADGSHPRRRTPHWSPRSGDGVGRQP